MGTHPIFESDFDCLTERKMPIYKGKKVNRFNFDKNRKTSAKRTKAKIKKREQLKAGSAEEKVLGKVWDNRRSFKQNFASIGLSVDPNKAVKIGKTRIMTDGEEVQKKSKRQEKVIKELETVAANARVKDWTVSQDDIHFCVNIWINTNRIGKHGKRQNKLLSVDSSSDS